MMGVNRNEVKGGDDAEEIDSRVVAWICVRRAFSLHDFEPVSALAYFKHLSALKY